MEGAELYFLTDLFFTSKRSRPLAANRENASVRHLCFAFSVIAPTLLYGVVTRAGPAVLPFASRLYAKLTAKHLPDTR